MLSPSRCPVVHLELRTGNLAGACTFFSQSFGWRAEIIHVGAQSYVTLECGARVGIGVVEADADPPGWLPYVEVTEIRRATGTAERYGATIRLDPREGPVGWHSLVTTPDGAEVGLWQPKR
jgi:predicted enzyme related to lactoylglutathione lyase